MAAALRLRADAWHDAGRLRAIRLGAVPDPRSQPSVRWDPGWLEFVASGEPARVGDVWAFRQRPDGPHVVLSYGGSHPEWPLACYALVCPVERCKEGAHCWHHAYDCAAGTTRGAACKRGAGRLSCWDWSGSVEAGTLSAQPSLQVCTEVERAGKKVRLDTCGFHGFLTGGVLA